MPSLPKPPPEQASLPVIPPRPDEGAPPWFVGLMHDGVVMLCGLALRDKPATALAEHEAAVLFAESLWRGRRWDQAQDSNRIRIGWYELRDGARHDPFDRNKFPLPQDLAEAIPRRQEEHAPVSAQALTNAEAKAAYRLLAERVRPPSRGSNPWAEERDQLRTINAVLRHNGLPVFRAIHEARMHKLREAAVGKLLAELKTE